MNTVTRPRGNCQQFSVVILPNHEHSDNWTPRRELLSWLVRRKLRVMVAEARLVLRVSVAVVLGDRRRCNLALDELIVREEAVAK